MRLVIPIFVIACFLLPAGQAAANPFKGGASAQAAPPPTQAGLVQGALMAVNQWQRQLKSQMSRMVRRVERTGEPGPVLMLLAFAFAYGFLHAAGPGHGKAVTMIYVITQRRLGAGLIMGNLVALTHGLSGIVLVLLVRLALQASVRTTLGQVTYITQLASYGLISLLGAFLLARSLPPLFRQTPACEKDEPEAGAPPWAMGLATGMVPCPGAVLVMLFCLSLGMVWLGVLSALAMSLGMAASISLVALLAYWGKAVSLKATSGFSKKAELVRRMLETLAASGVLALGLLFLAATAWGGTG